MLKKLSYTSFLLGLLSSSTAYAVFPGPYAGLTLGEAYTHYSASNTGLTSASVDNDGFAGSVYAGYQFTPHWGLEAAYVQFPSTSFTNIVGGSGSSSGTINENAIQFMLKGTAPISDLGFNITAKAGAAWINATSSHAFNGTSGPNEAKVSPAYGVGLSYDVTPSTPLEISWTRIQKSGDIQNADLLGLSLTYFFN